ncbi:hypothetical protein P4O66_004915 [Electrophorus voltai]|uniref:Palmitoyltransferase n=1 Tax=Electrophorus voltai TaxID=2609070 RepID=A0AAD8ZVZ0_9TELE|nr:hypothetical protein P4O66_004915 [Electrophorus voltai]
MPDWSSFALVNPHMSCFERRLRRTAPGHGGSQNELVVAPIHSRVNGWSCPLHVLQPLAWLVYAFMAIVGFGVYIPLLPPPWNYLSYGVTGTACVLHLLTHVAAVTIDPADYSVRVRKDYSSPMPVFDKKKHPHVIHNQHCYLCEVDVPFFVTVLSAVVGVFLLFLVILYIFIEHFVNPANLRTAGAFQGLKGNGTWLAFLPLAPVETSSTSLLVLAFITIIVALVSLLLLCHLLVFHIYLLSKGMSTYEYIVKQRQLQSAREQKAGGTQLSPSPAVAKGLGHLDMPIDCDAPLSSRPSVLCTADPADPSPMLILCCPVCWCAGEAVAVPPVGWSPSLSQVQSLQDCQQGTAARHRQAEGVPVVQGPLSTSDMDTTTARQQLIH